MMKQYVVLVCGSRHFRGDPRVFRVLDKLDAERQVDVLVCGGATGVDAAATRWAERRGVQIASFPVPDQRWRREGLKAGPQRNRLMLKLNPELVVAFPGGKGTSDRRKAAREAKVTVLWFESWSAVEDWVQA